MSAPVKRKSPEPCPGAYVLHAYCDHDNPDHEYRSLPAEVTDVQTLGQAKRRLRSIGWVFHQDGTATCPICVKALRRLSNPGAKDV